MVGALVSFKASHAECHTRTISEGGGLGAVLVGQGRAASRCSSALPPRRLSFLQWKFVPARGSGERCKSLRFTWCCIFHVQNGYLFY